MVKCYGVIFQMNWFNYNIKCINYYFFLIGKMDWKWQTRTWDPQCNVPKATVDAYEKGDQEPKVNFQQMVGQFGVTAVTNITVKASNERSFEKMKMNYSVPNQR